MRQLATVLVVAAAIPALADSPALTTESPKFIYNVATAPTRCYFIRQTNRQLRTPQDKPGFMPLAAAEKLSTAVPFANCMPDQRVIKTVIK